MNLLVQILHEKLQITCICLYTRSRLPRLAIIHDLVTNHTGNHIGKLQVFQKGFGAEFIKLGSVTMGRFLRAIQDCSSRSGRQRDNDIEAHFRGCVKEFPIIHFQWVHSVDANCVESCGRHGLTKLLQNCNPSSGIVIDRWLLFCPHNGLWWWCIWISDSFQEEPFLWVL